MKGLDVRGCGLSWSRPPPSRPEFQMEGGPTINVVGYFDTGSQARPPAGITVMMTCLSAREFPCPVENVSAFSTIGYGWSGQTADGHLNDPRRGSVTFNLRSPHPVRIIAIGFLIACDLVEPM